MIFLNIRNSSPNNTALHPKRPESSAALLFERHVSCSFHYVQCQTQTKLISVDIGSSSPIYIINFSCEIEFDFLNYTLKFCGTVT
jgi:hypothetical protein